MKKIAAAVVLSVSTGAFAQQLGDLNFFQKAGSIKWNTDLHSSSFDGKDENGDKVEYSRMGWANSVAYGLADNLNLGLAIDYDFQAKKKETGNKDTKDNAFSDVTVLGNYRLMDKGTFVDFDAALTLGLATAKRSSPSNTEIKGNNNQGHHSLAVGASAGQIINSFEWRARVGADYHFSGEVDLKPGTTTADTESYLNWVIGAAGQYRLDNAFALHAGVNYVLADDQEIKFSGNKMKFKFDNYTALNAGVKYNLSESALLKFDYETRMSHKTMKNSGAFEKVQGDNTFALGAEFLF